MKELEPFEVDKLKFLLFTTTNGPNWLGLVLELVFKEDNRRFGFEKVLWVNEGLTRVL